VHAFPTVAGVVVASYASVVDSNQSVVADPGVVSSGWRFWRRTSPPYHLLFWRPWLLFEHRVVRVPGTWAEHRQPLPILKVSEQLSWGRHTGESIQSFLAESKGYLGILLQTLPAQPKLLRGEADFRGANIELPTKSSLPLLHSCKGNFFFHFRRSAELFPALSQLLGALSGSRAKQLCFERALVRLSSAQEFRLETVFVGLPSPWRLLSSLLLH